MTVLKTCFTDCPNIVEAILHDCISLLTARATYHGISQFYAICITLYSYMILHYLYNAFLREHTYGYVSAYMCSYPWLDA